MWSITLNTAVACVLIAASGRSAHAADASARQSLAGLGAIKVVIEEASVRPQLADLDRSQPYSRVGTLSVMPTDGSL
jgi:hypothetical protein